jgi:hypothetical protein
MKLYVIINIILCFSNIASAQDFNGSISIEIGSKDLKIDEPLVISVILKDAENRPAVIFPEIDGLQKRSKSATSSLNTIDGKKVVIQTISQEYFAGKAGQYQIPDFFVLVNGVKIRSGGTMVHFSTGLPAEETSSDENFGYLPDQDLNGEDVFLSVRPDKKSVFIREGFALRISLYIAENAPVEMEFYQFNTQLQSILKKIRPANCWEENVGIEEIVKRQVKIRGRDYTEYNMYQAQFFPITLQDIIFPVVSLDMLVVDNNSAVNVRNKVVKVFRSKPAVIKVRPLPAHPLVDQVAVGRYSLIEKLSGDLVYPGESVRYIFKIKGEGNIAAITSPVIEANSAFDFYPPEKSQEIIRSYSKISGEVSFDYFVVPRRDGEFPLSRYFQWIYFDPVAMKYDTLKSVRTLQVKGEDYELGNISLSGSAGLYDDLESLSTTEENFNYKDFFKSVTNAVVILLMIVMIWVLRK